MSCGASGDCTCHCTKCGSGWHCGSHSKGCHMFCPPHGKGKADGVGWDGGT